MMKVDKVETIFIKEKTVKFYDYGELLHEEYDVKRVTAIKPDLVMFGNVTNVRFEKSVTCEITKDDKGERTVRCG